MFYSFQTEHNGTWMHGRLDSWENGFMADWIHGTMDAWEFGFMAQWINSSLDALQFGFMALWMCGSLYAWCFQKHPPRHLRSSKIKTDYVRSLSFTVKAQK